MTKSKEKRLDLRGKRKEHKSGGLCELDWVGEEFPQRGFLLAALECGLLLSMGVMGERILWALYSIPM